MTRARAWGRERDLQLGERLIEGAAGVVGAVERVVELAGEKDVGAVETGGVDGLTDPLLVAVHLRRVDVPVADLRGVTDGAGGVLGLDLKEHRSRAGGWCDRC